MHDCNSVQEKLIDLVFNELDAIQERKLKAEINSCALCRDNYQSMTKTLVAFDQATEAAQPDESFWPAYDEKLRARLSEESRRSIWKRFTEFKVAPFVPLPLAAALILGVIALALIWGLHKGKALPDPVPHKDNGFQATAPVPEVNPVETPQSPKEMATLPPKQVKKQLVAYVRKPLIEKAAGPSTGFTDPRYQVAIEVPRYSGPLANLIDPSLVKHLEKAQLLLRSFRNTDATNNDGVYDIAYEKGQSQRLLYQNIVLRRQAEAKGNMPTEELLSSLEPFLIDIANLPDKPAKDDIHSIKERMQRREIVASLQVYTAQTAPPY